MDIIGFNQQIADKIIGFVDAKVIMDDEEFEKIITFVNSLVVSDEEIIRKQLDNLNKAIKDNGKQ